MMCIDMTLQSTRILSKLMSWLAVAFFMATTACNAIELGIEPSGQLYVIKGGMTSSIDDYMEVAGFQYVGKLYSGESSSPTRWQVFKGDDLLRTFDWDSMAPSERCIIGKIGGRYYVLRPDGSTISGPHRWAYSDQDGYTVSDKEYVVVSHGWDGRIIELHGYNYATPYRGRYCTAWNFESNFILDERGMQVAECKESVPKKIWNGFIFRRNSSVFFFDGEEVQVDKRYSKYIVASPNLIFLFEHERRGWMLVKSGFDVVRKLPNEWEPGKIFEGTCLALNRATGALAVFYVETGELILISDYREGYGYLFSKTAERWKRVR